MNKEITKSFSFDYSILLVNEVYLDRCFDKTIKNEFLK
jgi:hypothetical protein